MSRAPNTSTLMDGFRVLGVAIRREPWVFTLSTLGSVLFGALTVADAWVLGWSTDHVVLPAFESGTTTTTGLIAIFALFLGVAILRAVGIVARRLGAGIMQYRMQAPTAARSPGSTSTCRCPGTSATRRASCCPTPTPTSRPRGRRSRRCRWPSARSR